MRDRRQKTATESAALVAEGGSAMVADYLQLWEREARRAARELSWYGRRAKALRAAVRPEDAR